MQLVIKCKHYFSHFSGVDVLDERTGAIDALTCITPNSHNTVSLRKSLSDEGLVPNNFGPADDVFDDKRSMEESDEIPRSGEF